MTSNHGPRRLRLILPLVMAVGVVAAACGASSPGGPVQGAAPSSSTPPASTTTTAPSPDTATVALSVGPGNGGGAFSKPKSLTVPPDWTAEVWARVPDARMEAWTPEGDLLVSEPDKGRVVEVTPGSGGATKPRNVLTGLTSPQGLAFAKVSGQWVLYVGESDQIDRYPWSAGGVSGPQTVIAARLPDLDSSGDDVHRPKDVVVAPDGSIYFDVGSSSNADPADRTMNPPRAVIMAVNPDGSDLRVVETGVRNGEGLAVAPDGSVWTAVNERDNIPFPFHSAYGGHSDAFGQVIQAYVDEHPTDEVVPVTTGRDLGWPYCDPDPDENQPVGSLAHVPFVANSQTNPGGTHLDCASLAPIAVGLPAHSAPLGMSFLEGSSLPATWSDGAVVAVHGSWNRVPPRPPAVLWMAWNAARHTLEPAVTLIGGFQNANGSRWGRPVDAVPGPDGALYVTDDQAGAVYRLVPPR
jgi:glucose/arabinose dehydrogenase